ncbi:hypothetical protein [Dietzia sp. ANT_WB102]|uniref:hypothetical protein n=1 Tax=Dietzia sp. ANT_WB102 TaxID=2597345 RepID=UPI0011EF89B3|nr:hypothetical protein [Dietzia sp. ANT_WB102]KAA0918214.1 hypothetical protein FQ137_02250 [Dietzia sp. ANT_WB102]
MTAPRSSDSTSEVARGAIEAVTRSRGRATVAYVAATVLGGLGALVIVAVQLLSGRAAVLDVLVWSALAVMLLGAAAHRWWLGGRNEERSRRIAETIRSEQVATAVRGSSGDIDAVRRLRVAHPGLGLRDAYELYQRHACDSH